MNIIRVIKKHALLSILLVMAFNTWATNPIQLEGVIDQLDNQTIMINDRKFQLSPTVKVFSTDSRKIEIRDLKLEDYVSVIFIEINSRLLVDQILIKEAQSTENETPSTRR